MESISDQESDTIDLEEAIPEHIGPRDEDPEPYLKSENLKKDVVKIKTGKKSFSTGSSTIQKIVIFYSDGAFSEHHPLD